ncbi:MAG: phosphoglycolate phosphatase [Methylococcaceae bacterium]
MNLVIRPKLIAFDLDGTLVESAPDLADAIDQMLRELGRPEAGETAVRLWIGNGVGMLVKRALTGQMWPDNEPPGFEQALECFSRHYEQGVCRRSTLYPGVREGLTRLKAEAAYHLVCITNKHSRFTHPLLEQLGIHTLFDWVGCGDQFTRHKPDPESLLHAAQRYGLAPAACWMVGDSPNDVQAARAAGFGILCVPYGYPGDVEIEGLGADAIITTLDALPEWFRQYQDSPH